MQNCAHFVFKLYSEVIVVCFHNSTFTLSQYIPLQLQRLKVLGQSQSQSSGAVWKSRWLSWAFRPNKPYGFHGRKAILNHAHTLVSALSLICQPISEDVKQHNSNLSRPAPQCTYCCHRPCCLCTTSVSCNTCMRICARDAMFSLLDFTSAVSTRIVEIAEAYMWASFSSYIWRRYHLATVKFV